MRTGRDSSIKVIVDGALTTNFLTLSTGLGATAIVLIDPIPTDTLTLFLIKSAIPFVFAGLMKVLGSFAEIWVHRRKIEAELKLRQANEPE